MKPTSLSPLLKALSLLIALLSGLSAQTPSKPNILIIISDDLGQRLGCYGDTTAKTPNIDSLAKRGLLFENAAPQYPVCNPSRTSFLSGMRPEESGVWGNETPLRTALPNVVTLPQALKEGGYFTAGFGKVFHIGAKEEEAPERMDMKNSWSLAEYIPSINKKNAPKMISNGFIAGGTGNSNWWGIIEDSDEPNDPDYKIASAAIEAMKKSEGKPWMVVAGFHLPHSAYIAPKKYFDLFPLDSINVYEDPADMSKTLPSAIPSVGNFKFFQTFKSEDKKRFTQAYYASVAMMDAQVGRLLDDLQKTGNDKNTIVLFMGDNGFHLGEREWWNKVTLWNRSSKVPFIMAGPGIVENRICKSPVELLDIYPTMMDKTGLTTPQKLSGQSIRPLLENPEEPGKGYAFTMVARGKGKTNKIGRTVRTNGWRYTEWDNGKEGVELYDETKDPLEVHDLSNDPEKKEVLESMKALFKNLPEINPNAAALNGEGKSGGE